MRRVVVALVAAVTTAAAAHRPAAAQAMNQPPARTDAREQVRARFAQLLRERVGLTDEQLRRLAPISQTFDARRQALFREERAVRQGLRRELSGASPDQARVAMQIDRLFALQRRRLDLAAEEQRELAAFMNPAQRARYLALQEHLRRRADDMRRRRRNGPPRGTGRRGAPGPGPQF